MFLEIKQLLFIIGKASDKLILRALRVILGCAWIICISLSFISFG